MFVFQPYVTVFYDKSRPVEPPVTNVSCRQLSREEYEWFLQDPALSNKLLPAGMIVIGCEPFVIHPINFEAMASEYNSIHASYTSVEDPSEITGLSLGTGIGGNGCLTYDCAIYCNSKHPTEFAQHIYTHIPLAQEMSEFSNISMRVFGQFPNELDFLAKAFKAVDEIDGNENFTKTMRIQTYTLGSVPLKNYLETTRVTLEEINKANNLKSNL